MSMQAAALLNSALETYLEEYGPDGYSARDFADFAVSQCCLGKGGLGNGLGNGGAGGAEALARFYETRALWVRIWAGQSKAAGG